MTDPTLESLTRRLDRLERENRRLKFAGTILLLLLVVVGSMGQALPKAVPKVVEAERFLLRDASGIPRAMLATQASGAVGLVLTDKAGVLRASLKVLPSGSPGLDFYDQNKKSRIVFGVQEDNRPVLVFYDQKEKSRVNLEVRQDGTPALVFGNQDGRPKAGLEVRQDGQVRVAFFGELSDGPARAAVGVDADGSPSFALFDKGGKVIWKAP